MVFCANTGAQRLVAIAEANKTAEDLLRKVLVNPFIDCGIKRSFFV